MVGKLFIWIGASLFLIFGLLSLLFGSPFNLLVVGAAIFHRQQPLVWPKIIAEPDLNGRLQTPVTVKIPIGTPEKEVIKMLEENGFKIFPASQHLASWGGQQDRMTSVRATVTWQIDDNGRLSHIEGQASRSSL